MKKIKMKKKNKSLTFLTIMFVILDLLAISGFVVMYGPWDYFKNLFVTTAMKTRSHKYLAYVFYTEKMVEDIEEGRI